MQNRISADITTTEQSLMDQVKIAANYSVSSFRYILNISTNAVKYALSNPLKTITSLLAAQMSYVNGSNNPVPYNLWASIPETDITSVLNANWQTSNCSIVPWNTNFRYDFDMDGADDFEGSVTYSAPDCETNPYIKLSQWERTSVFVTNSSTSMNNYAAFRFPIKFVSAPVLTSCVNLNGNGTCWFPVNDGFYTLYAMLGNTKNCRADQTGEVGCDREFAVDPLVGIWQGKDSYPHLSYNNNDSNMLTAIFKMPLNPQEDNGTSCYLQYSASGWARVFEISRHGAYYAAPIWSRDAVVIGDSPRECNQIIADQLQKSKYCNQLNYAFNFWFANNSSQLIIKTFSEVSSIFSGYDYTLERVSGGSIYYQDKANNTYSVMTSFDLSQAEALAKFVDQACHLHLSRINTTANNMTASYKVTANNGCNTELHHVDFNSYASAITNIRQCITEAFYVFTNKTIQWPQWLCPIDTEGNPQPPCPSPPTPPSSTASPAPAPSDKEDNTTTYLLAAGGGLLGLLGIFACVKTCKNNSPQVVLDEQRERLNRVALV